MAVDFIFSILILIFSVVAHEVSHGYAAYALGDNTAKFAGRLTLNPLKHLEWFGSVILPVLLALSGAGFIIGWAKPVPFNPYNLRNQRWGEALVAIAGPVANICIALFFGLILRFGNASGSLPDSFLYICGMITLTNLVLATFNLVPIPPLDGSKILFSLFPNSLWQIRRSLESAGFILVLIFVFFLWQYMLPVVSAEFHLLTGLSF
jgi:Zn-dependent protease